MKKILFGAQWGEQKDTVLEAVRTTASTATSVSQGVGEIVGGKVAELRSDGDSTNGNVLSGTRQEDSGGN
jgi:hypothetical protein